MQRDLIECPRCNTRRSRWDLVCPHCHLTTTNLRPRRSDSSVGIPVSLPPGVRRAQEKREARARRREQIRAALLPGFMKRLREKEEQLADTRRHFERARSEMLRHARQHGRPEFESKNEKSIASLRQRVEELYRDMMSLELSLSDLLAGFEREVDRQLVLEQPEP